MQIEIPRKQAKLILSLVKRYADEINRSRDGWTTEEENAAIQAMETAITKGKGE